MSGNNNKKFLFRQPGLDPELDNYEQLPRDIAEWLDPNAVSSRGAGAQGGNAGSGLIFLDDIGTGSALPPDTGAQEPVVPYVPDVPGLTARAVSVLSVVRQEVKQDPQGGATVTVTLSIGPEQDNMEYELRLTKTP